MTYTQILSEKRGKVAVLTLNRPDKLNAWTRTLSSELEAAIEEGATMVRIGTAIFGERH